MKSDFNKRLGRAISMARRARKLSQQTVALHIGVNRSTLSNYENGRAVPAETLSKIAIALRIKPSHFFEEAQSYGRSTHSQSASRRARLEAINERLSSVQDIGTLDAILHILQLDQR